VALTVGVLAVGLSVSLGATVVVRGERDQTAAGAADHRASALAEAVRDESARYVNTVVGVAAAVGAFDVLTADKFARVVAPLRGMQLVGATSATFLVPTADDQVPQVETFWRSQGVPDLVLKPAASDHEHFFSVLSEPLDGSAVARRGIDLSASPEAAAALGESRRTGRVAVSDTYRLLVDRDLPADRQQLSFVLVAPVFGAADATGSPPFRGWVIMGLRGGDFIGATLAKAGQGDLDVRLSARNSDGAPAQVAQVTAPVSGPRAPSRHLEVVVGQRSWQLEIAAVASLLPGTGGWWTIPAGGAVLSVLLAVLVGTLATGRARARADVEAATAGLRAAEADARGQAELLEAILDNVSDGVGVVDGHGEFLLHNPAAKVLLGIGEDQGGAETWQEHYGIFLPDGRTPFPTEDLPLVRALAGETRDQVPMVIRNFAQPDGVVITVSGRPLPRPDGTVGAVAVFHDITAQHVAEAALRRDRDHSEAVAEVAATIASTGVRAGGITDTTAVAEAVSDELAGRIADLAAFTVHDPATGWLNVLAVAGQGADDARRLLQDGPVHIDSAHLLARAARDRETVVVDTEDPATFAAQIPQPYRSFVQRFPAYHLAHVPLVNGTDLLGVITIMRFRPEPFDRYDLDLIEQVAVRASWAMTKARHSQEQARTEQALRANQTVLEGTNRELQAAVHDASRERDFSSMLLGAMHEGFLFTVDGELRDVNDQFCAMTGFARQDLIGQRRPYPFWPAEHVEALTAVAHRMQAEGSVDVEAELARRDGRRFPAAVSIRVVGDTEGASRGWLITVSDITAFKEREEALIAAAGRDPLTGLANRRSIDEHYERLRPGDAVIVLDLDHFKTVNDTHGHAAGDQTLVTFATCITETLRGKDWAGRLGGEEFIIVARDGHRDGAQSVLARLADRWAATSPLITFSAGIAVHAIGVERHQTLARADEALYTAKRKGRNRTEVFTDPRSTPAGG
jgi:diguanylate cyclase (GGDEF)-like protein/PAS domain S-box-containing protein